VVKRFANQVNALRLECVEVRCVFTADLFGKVRRRLIRATDDAEVAWWQEVIGACAL